MHTTTDIILAFMERATALIAEKRDELITLDAAIGDADHGANLERGFNAAFAKVALMTTEEPGTILRTIGTTLVSTVGGSSGPLYGTAFIRAGSTIAGKLSLNKSEIIAVAEAALEGVMARGKAQVGEKTMVDTLAPSVAALRSSLNDGLPMRAALNAMLEAAEQGMQATIPMQASKGRASYLGERSIGHQDPGATSAYYLILALKETSERFISR
ncbi:MAG: dihydroxyacetone kinase subunit DhaL [Roseiflexaceae bacterium]